MASKTRAPARRRRASQPVRPRRASKQARPRRASFPRQPRRPPPRPLYSATPDLLAHGRRLFEQSGETIPAIAAVMGCSRSTVYRIARSERWLRYAAPAHDLPRALKLALEAEKLAATLPPRSGGEGRLAARQQGEPGWGAAASTQAPPTPDPSPPRAARAGGGEQSDAADLPPDWPADLPPVAEAVARMYRAALEELSAVETLRAQLKRQPHSPLDADRTARALSSLQALVERLQRQQLGLLPTTGPADDDIPTDIDEFRARLTRRIEAFLEAREAEGDGG